MSNSSLVNYTKISPNRTSPRNHKIDTITIHCVVGQCTAESLGNIFAPASRKASSNYGVDKDGRIGMYCEEKDRSWCSSSASNDHRAVTIEVASDTKEPYAVTDKALKATIKLVADICKRNGINKLIWFADKQKTLGYTRKAGEACMTVHRWFANKSCPGTYLYSKHQYICDEVNKLLKSSGGTTPAPAKPASDIQVAKYKDAAYNKSFTTTADLNMRTGAGTDHSIILTIPKGKRPRCYGYYNKVGNQVWLYVAYNGKVGYCSKAYLK